MIYIEPDKFKYKFKIGIKPNYYVMIQFCLKSFIA